MATAKATEVSELNRKLKLADDEIDRVNKRFDEAQGMCVLFLKQFNHISEVICKF